MQSDTQNSLINKVVLFLNNNGCCVWRQENYGRFDSMDAVERLTELVLVLRQNPQISKKQVEKAVQAAVAKSWRKVPDNVKGVADVIGWEIGTGRWIAVEVKIGSDQLRAEQEQWLRKLRSGGGRFFLCREFGSFVEGWGRR